VNELKTPVVMRLLLMMVLSLWMLNATAETQRKVSKQISAIELEQLPYTVTFSFYESADASTPFFVETYFTDQLEWEEIDERWKITALISADSVQQTEAAWYEVTLNDKKIDGRQKLMAVDPNSPDISVEGYIETRAGGIKFADDTTQTTAADPASYQNRVTGTCAAGSSISSINQDGSVNCEPDSDSGGDITGVSVGSGLSGGGLTGDVSIDIDPAVVQQRVSSTCPAGKSIRTVNQDGSVVCSDTPTPPLCNGTNEALQWNGSQYTCTDIRQLGASAGDANGFEISDAGNETWDGFQRPKLAWADAKQACEDDGGRLPTITELYRNNATSGSGNLSNPSATDYQWTLIAGETGTHAAVRLSDGLVSNYTNSTPLNFRCVWPDVSDNLFTENNCYTKTGSCEQTGLVWNIDADNRPPMNFMNAVNECNFYGASVPALRDMSEYIHQTSQSNEFNYTWASDAKYWHSANMGMTVYKWSQQEQDFAYQTGSGSIDFASSKHLVRCIGKNSAVGQLPGPVCSGGCFQLDQRRSRILSDSTDRTATDYASAAETCRLLGGSLPDNAELTDLIHAGLANGSNTALWSSDPLYWYNGNTGTLGYRWSGTGTDDWTPGFNTTNFVHAGTSSRPYRCIWNEKLEATPTVCAANQKQTWNGSQFSCLPSIDGSSGGSIPFEFVDAWGNAWDLLERSATDLATATANCDADGGRLPTATEIFRLRANQGVAGVTSIGTASDVAYLWTNIVADTTFRNVLVRVSDGNTTTAPTGSNYTYRCIWPAEKGDVLAGRSCYGEPANGCYQSGDLRADSYDRPAIPQASASNECEFYGGRLPDLDEFQELIHSGAPNGTDEWSWINEPIYWFSGNYGYAKGKWSGTGVATWLYNSVSGNGGLAASNQSLAFRCVFSNRMN